MSAIMKSELDRVAGVAVGHGRDDPALEVFLAFVAALEPSPEAPTLEPAARRIGKLRLAQALDRPGESRAGACRLLTASAAGARRVVALPARATLAPAVLRVAEASVESDAGAGTGRWISELFEDLLRAIRVVVSLLA